MIIPMDANIAYLLLMLGLVLTIFAIAPPYTGVVETLAVVVLLAAGYFVLQLGITLWALALLIVSMVPFIISLFKRIHWVWLILGLVGTMVGSAYLFPTTGPLPAVNPLLAIICPLLLAGFAWLASRLVLKAAAQEPIQNPDKVIGESGVAKTPIHDSGTVQVGGELWSARSKAEIPAGGHVKVTGRNGLTLDVREEK